MFHMSFRQRTFDVPPMGVQFRPEAVFRATDRWRYSTHLEEVKMPRERGGWGGGALHAPFWHPVYPILPHFIPW